MRWLRASASHNAMSIAASAMPTSPCAPSSRKRRANFCSISAGARGSPCTRLEKLRISSATGFCAIGVYVNTTLWPIEPSSQVTSVNTSGDSATAPLAV